MPHNSRADILLTNKVSDTFKFSDNLDTEFLTKTYNDNLAFGEKMFSIFVKTNPTDMQELEAAIGIIDYEVIRSIAHKIKNNYTWVGLSEMSSLMYKIETAAKAKAPELIPLYQNLKKAQKDNVLFVLSEHKRLMEYLNLENS